MSLKVAGWVLALLAVAFPAAAHAILAVLAAVTVVALAHPTPACVAVAVLLLAGKLSAFRRATQIRRMARWGWVA